jgi:altronate dehydratase large subunit
MKGFDHGNRGIGVRDHQLILPSVVCSTRVSSRIAKEIGAITFAHQHGCGFIGNDVGRITDYFAALANHPNVSSTLVVGLGCETIQGNELADKLLAKNKSTNYLVTQESGGVQGTVDSGVAAAKALQAYYQPTPVVLPRLHLGIDLSNDDLNIRILV